MTNLPCKPSRVDFNAIDVTQLRRILKSGDLNSLTPQERTYFGLMQVVRDLNARIMMPGGRQIVTKAGIIKLLKSPAYELSDWMARRVYGDAINFFNIADEVSPKAWSNLYADRLDKLAALAISTGHLKDAKGYIVEAAKLRGCYDQEQNEIPDELLNAAPVVLYTADPVSMGAPKADRRELDAFIDAIPDLPEVARRRVKQDAGIERRDMMQRMFDDIKEFSEDEE